MYICIYYTYIYIYMYRERERERAGAGAQAAMPHWWQTHAPALGCHRWDRDSMK